MTHAIARELNVGKIREDFPILARQVHGHRLVYLDNAATTQKPVAVLDALRHYYEHTNANIHRGIHTLANEATEAYEGVRANVARFIGADDPRGVLFIRNATEAINVAALRVGRAAVKAGDEILLTEMEHHSNLVPWIMLRKPDRGHAAAPPHHRTMGILDIAASDD